MTNRSRIYIYAVMVGIFIGCVLHMSGIDIQLPKQDNTVQQVEDDNTWWWYTMYMPMFN
jgi:hypothetical protein